MTETVTRRAFGTPPSPAELARDLVERLDGTAAEYTGAASYHRTVREVARLAKDGIERYERSREDELRGATDALRKEIDRERQRAEKAERELTAAREAMERKPVKEIELFDQMSRLRFPRPQRDNSTRGRRWTVSDLESVAYDIRLAGGQDDAAIDIHDHAFIADVPFPEAVTQARSDDRRPAVAPGAVVDLTAEAEARKAARARLWFMVGCASFGLSGVVSVLSRLFS